MDKVNHEKAEDKFFAEKTILRKNDLELYKNNLYKGLALGVRGQNFNKQFLPRFWTAHNKYQPVAQSAAFFTNMFSSL